MHKNNGVCNILAAFRLCQEWCSSFFSFLYLYIYIYNIFSSFFFLASNLHAPFPSSRIAEELYILNPFKRLKATKAAVTMTTTRYTRNGIHRCSSSSNSCILYGHNGIIYERLLRSCYRPGATLCEVWVPGPVYIFILLFPTTFAYLHTPSFRRRLVKYQDHLLFYYFITLTVPSPATRRRFYTVVERFFFVVDIFFYRLSQNVGKWSKSTMKNSSTIATISSEYTGG